MAQQPIKKQFTVPKKDQLIQQIRNLDQEIQHVSLNLIRCSFDATQNDVTQAFPEFKFIKVKNYKPGSFEIILEKRIEAINFIKNCYDRKIQGRRFFIKLGRQSKEFIQDWTCVGYNNMKHFPQKDKNYHRNHDNKTGKHQHHKKQEQKKQKRVQENDKKQQNKQVQIKQENEVNLQKNQKVQIVQKTEKVQKVQKVQNLQTEKIKQVQKNQKQGKTEKTVKVQKIEKVEKVEKVIKVDKIPQKMEQAQKKIEKEVPAKQDLPIAKQSNKQLKKQEPKPKPQQNIQSLEQGKKKSKKPKKGQQNQQSPKKQQDDGWIVVEDKKKKNERQIDRIIQKYLMQLQQNIYLFIIITKQKKQHQANIMNKFLRIEQTQNLSNLQQQQIAIQAIKHNKYIYIDFSDSKHIKLLKKAQPQQSDQQTQLIGNNHIGNLDKLAPKTYQMLRYLSENKILKQKKQNIQKIVGKKRKLFGKLDRISEDLEEFGKQSIITKNSLQFGDYLERTKNMKILKKLEQGQLQLQRSLSFASNYKAIPFRQNQSIVKKLPPLQRLKNALNY